MIVGVCRLSLHLPGAQSLKDKRQVVRRVLDRTRGKFNVAAAEVGHLDLWQRAALGFVVVSNDARHAQSMIDQIVAFVDSLHLAEILDRDVDVHHYGEDG